jgi:MinD-like ATPase involved in chromosome partitioning or flagellar assembly
MGAEASRDPHPTATDAVAERADGEGANSSRAKPGSKPPERNPLPPRGAPPSHSTVASAATAPVAPPKPLPLTRRDLHNGHRRESVGAGTLSNALARLRVALSSELQRREWELDERLAHIDPLTRANAIAVLSPKGGVGKTTISFMLGNLLASRLRLRVVAVDANPDFGTLASLAPDDCRASRSLADLLADATEIDSAAELHPYVSRLPTGLHVLGAPTHAEVMAQMTAGLYARLIEFLEHFYEVVILDLGTGITGPIAQFAVDRADQSVVITTPEWITAAGVLGAVRYLELEECALVLNQVQSGRRRGSRDGAAIEETLSRHAVATKAAIPYDRRLRAMLDAGTYELSNLKLATRVSAKQLAAVVASKLV